MKVASATVAEVVVPQLSPPSRRLLVVVDADADVDVVTTRARRSGCLSPSSDVL